MCSCHCAASRSFSPDRLLRMHARSGGGARVQSFWRAPAPAARGAREGRSNTMGVCPTQSRSEHGTVVPTDAGQKMRHPTHKARAARAVSRHCGAACAREGACRVICWRRRPHAACRPCCAVPPAALQQRLQPPSGRLAHRRLSRWLASSWRRLLCTCIPGGRASSSPLVAVLCIALRLFGYADG